MAAGLPLAGGCSPEPRRRLRPPTYSSPAPLLLLLLLSSTYPATSGLRVVLLLILLKVPWEPDIYFNCSPRALPPHPGRKENKDAIKFDVSGGRPNILCWKYCRSKSRRCMSALSQCVHFLDFIKVKHTEPVISKHEFRPAYVYLLLCSNYTVEIKILEGKKCGMIDLFVCEQDQRKRCLCYFHWLFLSSSVFFIVCLSARSYYPLNMFIQFL